MGFRREVVRSSKCHNLDAQRTAPHFLPLKEIHGLTVDFLEQPWGTWATGAVITTPSLPSAFWCDTDRWCLLPLTKVTTSSSSQSSVSIAVIIMFLLVIASRPFVISLTTESPIQIHLIPTIHRRWQSTKHHCFQYCWLCIGYIPNYCCWLLSHHQPLYIDLPNHYQPLPFSTNPSDS